MDPSDDEIVASTRRWIERAVIGLRLCPFAAEPFDDERIRYCVSRARSADELVGDLDVELRRLHAADPAECETTLLIHPYVLGDFFEFNDFLDRVDATLDALDLTDAIQVASFHPRFRFAQTEQDDVENNTNRSPYPTLHLLREASVDRAVTAFGDTAKIYEGNIATVRNLGEDGWRRLWSGV
jgi:hypothetical protein